MLIVLSDSFVTAVVLKFMRLALFVCEDCAYEIIHLSVMDWPQDTIYFAECEVMRYPPDRPPHTTLACSFSQLDTGVGVFIVRISFTLKLGRTPPLNTTYGLLAVSRYGLQRLSIFTYNPNGEAP